MILVVGEYRMTCLPKSGGCERLYTDAFVAHLNRTEGTRYRHRACLDVYERTTAQPEALYVDEERGVSLVIERKSIAWPIDYAYRHSNDHLISEVVLHDLQGLPLDTLYELRLPILIEGKSKEVTEFAKDAAREIRASWKSIEGGTRIRKGNGDLWWQFGKVPEWDFDEGAPTRGLKVTWVGQSLVASDFIDPSNPPEQLLAALQRVYASCTNKFDSYTDARRVLVLDPFGNLCTEDLTFWQRLWAKCPPSEPIGEIWSGMFDWVTDEEEGWIFERLYDRT